MAEAAVVPAVAPTDEGAAPFRPLNVKDALSYLDRVKVTFSENTEVYDRFLNIMKDFKSQGIDTPGVIDRVSTLFRGHAVLIQGFNTFLPPGYRIECAVSGPEEGAITTITVTTPMGIRTKTQGNELRLGALPAVPTPSAINLTNESTIATPGAVSLLSGHLTESVVLDVNRPPMEFNHAINYVNKIKNRFQRDPDTYKSFLEILQTYQKEGKAIQEVYAQVTTLFHAAPDLLDEFKQFLPDTSAEPAQGTSATLGQIAAGGSGQRGGQKRPAAPLKKDEGSAKKAKPVRAKPEEKGKGKRVTKPDSKDTRKPEQYDHQPEYQNQPPAYASGFTPQFPVQNGSHGYAYEPPLPPPPPQPLFATKPLASQADIAFFNRVKNYLTENSTYFEFLKLLNLFTQGIIDLTTLVARGQLFIGGDLLLWKEFCGIVGWSEGIAIGDKGGRVEIGGGIRIIENIPALDGARRGKGDSGKGWKTYGPSYRQLPAAEISLSCSGRDALCWDVLNDEWTSQPSWASDEGFIAHKKNAYEEALHKSEEERHEYDYHIEANLRTIALLEPIATRIAIMEVEERATFRLKPGLGNQSKSIYQRVIKKVYGKEQGAEVIQVLHENPCVAVPIVLARLKQKDDEWKRALREWNRVWREVDAKNFWKSLDHQAINLKLNDKKNLAIKSLVSDIETIKREQAIRASTALIPLPRTQYSFEMKDRAVLADAVKLTFSYLDRMIGVSALEKDRIDIFLRGFLPLVFAITPNEFALDFTALPDEDSELHDGGSETGGSSIIDDSTDSSSMPATHRRGFGQKRTGADLRKKALKNAGGPADRAGARTGGRKSKVSSPAPASRATSPVGSVVDSDVAMGDGDSPAPAEIMEVDGVVINDLDSTPVPADGAHRMETPTLASPILASPTPEPNSEAGSSTSMSAAPSRTETVPLPSPAPVSVPINNPAPSNNFFAADMVLPDLPELIHPFTDQPLTVEARRQWNFFANTNYYGLLRVFQVVYSRLMAIKKSATALGKPPLEPGVQPNAVPSISMFSTMASRHAPHVVGEHHYQRGLILCEKLFDGEIDQNHFEEGLRGIFAIDGHILFTVDKLLHQLIKTSQQCMSENRSQDLLHLLVQDRGHPDRSTSTQQISYRTQAESILGSDENLYRFCWEPKKSLLSIQLVGKDSIALEDTLRIESDWVNYLERYVLAEPTKEVDSNGLKPYLTRNLKKVAPNGTSAYPMNLIQKTALQSKICMRSYRIFFVAGTEDLILRKTNSINEDQIKNIQSNRQQKKESLIKWIDNRVIELNKKKEIVDQEKLLLEEKKEAEKVEVLVENKVEILVTPEVEKEVVKEAVVEMIVNPTPVPVVENPIL